MPTRTSSRTEEFVGVMLRNSPNFAGLDEAIIQRLAVAKNIHYLIKGQFVFMDGDKVDSYIIILRGMVRLIKQSPCGRVFTISILQSGETLTDITIFNEVPAFVSAEAIRPTTILCIARDEFLSIVASNPVLASNIMGTVGKRVKSIIERVMYILTDKAERRVCKTILMLSLEYGSMVPFTHQDVADMAGVSRETTSRAIVNLQKLGIIHSYRGSFNVLNMDRLNQLFYDLDTE